MIFFILLKFFVRGTNYKKTSPLNPTGKKILKYNIIQIKKKL